MPHGTLNNDTLANIVAAQQVNFFSHPLFSGVKICNLRVEQVPPQIAYVVRAVRGRILSFCIIRIDEEVPRHQHTNDGEIYFGGEPSATVILENPGQKIQNFIMGNKTRCALLLPGGSHSVSSTRPTTFFGVKFETETRDESFH